MGPVRPRPTKTILRSRRSPAAPALLLVALFVTTSLSGCIAVDFFLPRKGEDGPVGEGNGVVRVWVAAQPGALPSDFAFFNLTFAPPGHMQDPAGTRFAPMGSAPSTIDLITLERDRKAAPLGTLIAPPGDYYGFSFRVLDANLTLSEVVGNDNGQEAVRYIHKPVATNTAPGVIHVEHGVFPDGVTDLYLEVDITRSLMYERGAYAQALVVVGVSFYVNGFKAHQERLQPGIDGTANDPDRPRVTPDPPTARFEAWDDENGKRLYHSIAPHKRVETAVGLGQDIRFHSRSFSNVRVDNEAARVVETRWNFGDGTSSASGTAIKNWTKGGVYDVSLTVRDEADLVSRTFGTFFVPYGPDEATTLQRDARAGTILLGSGNLDLGGDLHRADESFDFPEDLEDGGLRLGGYRLTLHFSDPTGGLSSLGTVMKMDVQSGNLDTEVQGTSPLVIETAGMPFWRGPITPWVATDVQIDLDLITGVYVSYDLTVEALYYENASKGYDPHPTHRHGEWLFGPRFNHLDHEGQVRPDEE